MEHLKKIHVNGAIVKCWLIGSPEDLVDYQDNYRCLIKDYFFKKGAFQQEKQFLPSTLLAEKFAGLK